MAKKREETQVTTAQAQVGVIASQAVTLVAGAVDLVRTRIRVNSEDAGSPKRGTNVDHALTTTLVFLLFRSTETMLKAAIGLEGNAFREVHRLITLHGRLSVEEQERLERDWKQRGSSNREDKKGGARPRTFHETLAYLDTLNLNESLYWWTEEAFDPDLLDRLIGDNETTGVLPDVHLTVSDATIVKSGKGYTHTSIAAMLAPLYEGHATLPPYTVLDSGLVIPRP